MTELKRDGWKEIQVQLKGETQLKLERYSEKEIESNIAKKKER